MQRTTLKLSRPISPFRAKGDYDWTGYCYAKSRRARTDRSRSDTDLFAEAGYKKWSWLAWYPM